MHTSNETIHIAIAESSVIIRGGVISALDRIPSIKAHIVEITSMDALDNCMRMHSPEILIVNPLFCGKFLLSDIKKEYPYVKCMALVTSYIDNSVLLEYDGSISIFDSLDDITSSFAALDGAGVPVEESDSDSSLPDGIRVDEQVQEILSQREKEIVVCVVRGLTNKEIADELFLSVHTVITHRRNISRKLQIHSVSGLTIYAIANKLIELKDIK